MANPQTTLPPTPREDIVKVEIDRNGKPKVTISRQWILFIQQIQAILSFTGGIAWQIVNKGGSKLSDLEERTHAMLQSVLGWTSGTSTEQTKHISNANGKKWEDHVNVTDGNPHGTDHDQIENIVGNGEVHLSQTEADEVVALDALNAGLVAKTANATYSPRTINGTANEVEVANGDGVAGNPTIGLPEIISTPRTFGDVTNNTTIESTGFMEFNGDGRFYEDIQFNMAPKATGAGHPTLSTWNTDFEEWAYAVGEHSNGSASEAPHWWAEGTAVAFHVHWTTGSGNYVNGDKVQWQLKVTAADSKTAEPYTVFPAATVLTGETAFTSTVAPWSNVRTVFSAFSLPTEWTKMGAQIKVRLERIAKTAGGTDPGTPPFVLQVGCHAIGDTNGSRTVSAK